MTTGQLTIAAGTQGSASGNRTFGPYTFSSQVAADQTTGYPMTTGNNSVTIPTGASLGLLIPPNMMPSNPLNTATITLKGANADTGILISTSIPFPLPFSSTQTTLIFSVSSACTLEIWWM